MRAWSWIATNLTGGFAFGTIQTPAGTSPTATVAGDTLNFTSTGGTITITGNSATKTINFDTAGGGVTGSGAANRVAIWSGASTLTSVSTFNFASSQLSVPSGSNTAPSYTFDGDLNTGMYRSAADTLNFTTAGTSRLSISSAGVVSIAALTQGSVLFAGASGAVSQDNTNFFFNDATNALTIGGTITAQDTLTLTLTGFTSNMYLLNKGVTAQWNHNIDTADVIGDPSRYSWRMEFGDNGAGFDEFNIQNNTPGGDPATWNSYTVLKVNGSGAVDIPYGNLSIQLEGTGLNLSEGATNPRAGLATLVGGTVTVSTGAVTGSSRFLITKVSNSTAHGNIWVENVVASTSFDINSDNVLDDATVYWIIIEPT